MSFAQVAKGYLSTIANKNSFSLITNMRVASVSTALTHNTTLHTGLILTRGISAFVVGSQRRRIITHDLDRTLNSTVSG